MTKYIMITKVRKYIECNKLLEKGEGVVIGLSGGADSVCLFRLLVSLRKEYELKLYTVHVNHGIRGNQADRDQAFVKNLASRYNIPCRVIYADIPKLAKEWKMTEEEAGRKVRYEAFEEEMKAKGAGKIAVAHHANDQVETILFRMCRGTGIKGVTGISPIRDNIIRPLLNIEKREIYDYLNMLGQKYVEDATNTCVDYDRNRIRELVIPQLEMINSRAVAHICGLSEKLSQITEWLEAECVSIYDDNVTAEENTLKIKAQILREVNHVLASELIRKMIGNISKSMKDVEERHIESVIALSNMESGRQIDLPYGIRAIREYNYIRIEKNKEEISYENKVTYNFSKSDMEKGVFVEINKVYLPESGVYSDTIKLEINSTKEDVDIEKNVYTNYADCDIIEDSLSIRRPEKSDYFLFDGNNKKMLSRYMIDSKIPRRFRDKLLVAACGNHVYMVIGGRVAGDCYVTGSTSDTLIIKAFVQ